MLLPCLISMHAVSQVKSSILNDYNDDNLNYHIGVHTALSKFEYRQIAQKFTAVSKGGRILKITLNRFIAVEHDNALTTFDETKFKIHIYTSDSSGKPGTKLNSADIIITDKASKHIIIDLKSENLIIPGTIFFVAIEYLRTKENERLTKASLDGTIPFIPPYGKFIFLPIYQPFINMSSKKGGAKNIWSMDNSNKWIAFDYFFPDLTDLAISAEIHY